jgi:hypothetical protein
MSNYQDVGPILAKMEEWGPETLTKVACAMLHAALTKAGQKSLYIENQSPVQPLVVVVGKDSAAPEVAEAVRNWAREKGLIK